VSGLAKACCTQAGPAHAARGDGMDRATRDLGLVTGTVRQATMTNGIDRLP